MKLSILVNYDFDGFQKYLNMGIEGFELTIGEDANHFFENFHNTKRIKEENNLTVASLGQWGSLKLGEGQVEKNEIEVTKKLVDCCAELNCSTYITGVNYDDSISYEKNLILAKEFLREIVEYAKTKNITVSVYNCMWNNFCYGPNEWVYLLTEIPELKIKYDPSHSYYNNKDYLEEIQSWGPKFGHFHIKGALKINGRRVDDPPAGLDQLDWKSILILLRLSEYHGFLSIEPHGTSDLINGDFAAKGIEYTTKYINDLLMKGMK